MSAKVKYLLSRFVFCDKQAVEERLEKLAREGWRLEKMGNYLWKLRAAERSARKFSLVWFPDGSDFNPGPTQGEESLAELCEQDGWELEYRWGQMQVFSNARPDATPIETDPEVQVDNIRRTMRKSFLPTRWLLLALCVYWIAAQGWQIWKDPAQNLAGLSAAMLPAFFLLFAEVAWELGSYFVWLRRAEKAARRGEFCALRANSAVSWVLVGAAALIMLSVVCLSGTPMPTLLLWAAGYLLTFAAANGMKAFLKKRGASRETNLIVSVASVIVLCLVFLSGTVYLILHFDLGMRQPAGTWTDGGYTMKLYDDPLPLRVEDLTEVPETVWSAEARAEESLFVKRTEYRHWPVPDGQRAPSLEYTVTQVKLPFLYGFLRDGLLRQETDVFQNGTLVFEDHYVPIDPGPWGAEKAYQVMTEGDLMNRYLACYEDRFLEIRFDWPPTEEQIRLAVEKLGAAS